MTGELRQRRPRLHDPKYLEFVRTKPCCVCRASPTEAAHIRMANPAIGKPSTGMSEKPDDRYSVPLCAWCHRESPKAQHKMNEAEFWRWNGIDPFKLAASLYRAYGGEGGSPKKRRTIIKPRLPKERRTKIPARKNSWPKRRMFPND